MTTETETTQTTVSNPHSMWNFLNATHPSVTNPAERRQAQLASVLTIIAIVLNLVIGVLNFSTSPNTAISVYFAPAIFAMLAFFLVRSRMGSYGNALLMFTLCSMGYLNMGANKLEVSIGLLFYIPFTLMIGSAILTALPILVLTVLNLGAIVAMTAMGIDLPSNITMLLGLVAVFGFTLSYLSYFRSIGEEKNISNFQQGYLDSIQTRTTVQAMVEQRTRALDRRASRLESAALVARAASEVHDMHELLDTVCNQISDRFGFYHVGIFLSDEDNRMLNLVAASSTGGQKMLARRHRLAIGREGIVGFTAAQKRPRIAQSVEADTVFLNNPDLPSTRSEVALPLLSQTRLIGVLDIQSEEENAFSADDLSTLQNMTDQIAMAIENIRLIDQSQTTKKSSDLTNTLIMTNAWKEKLGGRMIGYNYTPLGLVSITSENDYPEIDFDRDRTLRIPILLRRKEIGAISLLRNSNEPAWTESEREMAAGIATQLGLAIENARLLEEAQNRAIREQTINEFSSSLSQSLDIDTLLQKAVREIYRMPQVSQVSLFINPEQESLK